MTAAANRIARERLANLFEAIDALERMSVAELRRRYFEVFGEVSRSRNKDFLRHRVQYGIQELGEGRTLSERALARIEELTDKAPVRYAREATRPQKPRRPAPWVEPLKQGGPFGVPIVRAMAERDQRLPPAGTHLVARFKGQRYEITVGVDDVEFDGERFRTLSGVARAITGQHRNGFRFFGLGKEGDA